MILFISSCGKSAQKPAPQQQSIQAEQTSDKIPDQLKSIENSIEQIIQALDGPSITAQAGPQTSPKPQQAENKEQATKDQQGSQGGGSQGGQGGQSGQGGQGNQQQGAQQQKQPAQPQPQDPWEKITPLVNTLHYQWNNYMPMAVKAGAGKTSVENFSNALNNLTTTITGKNRTNTLMASNSLYAYIPDFYSLYKAQTSPDIKRIRYYIRSSILNASTANWTQADTDINNLKSTWSLYKNVVNKDQQDISSKLDFSIYELEKVVKDKNQPLSDIKGRVAMSNVEALEKALESK